ncbi:helix-turn-helix domain-containing protein [Herbiconiux sp. YIM B11900]|uniref:helix-turn-helix domain-containing protein n=1 Tax=Herbiconiux sp. YIM B11900 TaxID=3404131 RepID=UPI003F8248B1
MAGAPDRRDVPARPESLSRRDLLRRHCLRTSVIGEIAVWMIRLPAGSTVVRPTPPGEPRSVHLLLPVDEAIAVRERGGEQYVVNRRDLGWLPSWSLAAVHAARSCELAWVELPSRLLDAHSGLRAPVPAHPAPGSPLVPPVRAFLQTVVAGEHELDPLAARLFEDLLGSLVEGLMIQARGTYPDRGRVRPTLHAQAVEHIAALRENPELSPAQIARSLRISVRQLQRSFEEAGSTVASEIRRQRLAAAVAMLTDDAFDGLTVAEIAVRSGFRNDAELRRALAAGAGPTPTELRSRRPVGV